MTSFLCLLLMACGSDIDAKTAFDKGDYETAFKLWKPLADKGDAEAQNYLGILYYLGFGVNRDYSKAVQWYEKAARAGNPDAQRNYGDMLHFGRGIKKSNYLAYKWYFAASQQGNAGAGKQIEVITDGSAIFAKTIFTSFEDTQNINKSKLKHTGPTNDHRGAWT